MFGIFGFSILWQELLFCLAMGYVLWALAWAWAWAWASWQRFLLVSNNPRTVSIIKRQHIKLRALLFLASLLSCRWTLRSENPLFVLRNLLGFLGSN